MERTIEYNEKTYELKFNLKRIEIIENVLKTSLMGLFINGNGVLSIPHLKTLFAYSVKEVGANAFVDPKAGEKMAETIIEERGYVKVSAFVLEVLQEDCPFFFRAD